MSIDFGRACRDLFSTPNKWMTILGLCVSMLIPVAGYMVIIGYLARRFMRERMGYPPEDFEFTYFAEYLRSGLWPTLAVLVFSVIMVPIALVCMTPIFLAAPLMEQSESLGVALMIAGMIFYIIGVTVAGILCYPVLLRSTLTMSFKGGFSWSFMTSFLRKVGLSLFGYFVLLTLISVPLIMVGYLALVVGAYVVSAWMQFVLIHLLFQHYDLFLARGGEHIETNPELTRDLLQPTRTPPTLPPAAD